MTSSIVNNPKMLRLTVIQLLLLLYAMPVFCQNLTESCSNHNLNINFDLLHDTVWEHIEVKTINSGSSSSNSTQASLTTERHTHIFSPCKILKDHKSWSTLYNHSQCAESYVCFIRSHVNGSVISIEGYGPSGSLSYSPNMHSMHLQARDDDSSVPKSVAISFTCDKHYGLGKPVKSYTTQSATNFNWPTIIACENDSKMDFPALTKCYVYDDEGNERDLSPLIKSGYKVSSHTSPLRQFARLAALHVDKRSTGSDDHSLGSFSINVCSESKFCETKGSSHSTTKPQACYIDGKSMLPVGDVRDSSIAYDSVSDEVVLKTRTFVKTGNCSQLTTMIRFKCPHSAKDQVDSSNVLASRLPFLMDSDSCEAIILWDTDYACPTKAIEGNPNSCIVEDKATNRKIDLSPLKSIEKIVNITSDGEHSKEQVALKICGTFPPSDDTHKEYCGKESTWNFVTACHRSEDNFTHIVGSISDAKLRYTDGQVQLIYPTRKGGCSHSAVGETSPASIESPHPSTVVTFVCDKDAGHGEPVSVPRDENSNDCTYQFIWRTNLTCHDNNTSYSHRLVTSCVASNDDSEYDLSPLRKRHDENLWHAAILQPVMDANPSLKGKKIYLNVCAGLSKVFRNGYNKSQSLPPNVAVVIEDGQSLKSIGRDVSPPHWDEASKALVLQYVESPSSSNNLTIRSKFLFECTPGVIDSSPFLMKVERSKNSETYTFKWSNAAACPLKQYYGSDCQVIIPELGTVVNLNPLMEDEMFAKVITHGKYKYYMNICGNLTTSPCVHDKSNLRAGICQVDLQSNRSWTLGQANRNLTYFNGVLHLNYLQGDKYNDKNSTPRSAHISFVCSAEEKAELIEENNRTYFFRYFTRYACPRIRNMIPCLWSNGTHTIDLGRIAIHDDGQNHFDIHVPPSGNASATPSIYFVNICRPVNSVNSPSFVRCPEGSGACVINISAGSEKATSLGVPRSEPTTIDGYPTLIYQNGDRCQKDPSTFYSSKITFLCAEDHFTPHLERDTTVDVDACSQSFKLYTNETCGVFPPTSVDKSGTFRKPSTKIETVVATPAAEAEPVDSSYKPAASILLFVVTAILVTMCVGISLHPSSRNQVTSRLRTWVCGPVTSSNPIHYSQVPTDSRCQLVPLKEVQSNLNSKLAYPYLPPTTSPFPHGHRFNHF